MQIFIQTILNVQFCCTNHIHDILQTSIIHLENFSFSKTLPHYSHFQISSPLDIVNKYSIFLALYVWKLTEVESDNCHFVTALFHMLLRFIHVVWCI